MRKRRMEYKERKEGRIDGKLALKGHKRRPFQVTEQSTRWCCAPITVRLMSCGFCCVGI